MIVLILTIIFFIIFISFPGLYHFPVYIIS